MWKSLSGRRLSNRKAGSPVTGLTDYDQCLLRRDLIGCRFSTFLQEVITDDIRKDSEVLQQKVTEMFESLEKDIQVSVD